jgi:uncharacterized membrane protein YeaQ/YmgE (transglycosylase-associated protein family)
MLFFIIGLIVWGFIVGGLARLSLPGPDPMPWYATIGLGLGGSLIGGIVAWDNCSEYQQRYGEHRIMSPFAPIHSYDGGFDELGGLIRLMASRFVDVRDPIQIAHDRLKDRSVLRAA